MTLGRQTADTPLMRSVSISRSFFIFYFSKNSAMGNIAFITSHSRRGSRRSVVCDEGNIRRRSSVRALRKCACDLFGRLRCVEAQVSEFEGPGCDIRSHARNLRKPRSHVPKHSRRSTKCSDALPKHFRQARIDLRSILQSCKKE